MAMHVNIKVVPNAKENRIIAQSDTLIVRVTESPVHGHANAAVLKLLKSYYGKPIRLVAGATCKKKIIEIE
jgi:uncharacterized protein (TIGR00251 family)